MNTRLVKVTIKFTFFRPIVNIGVLCRFEVGFLTCTFGKVNLADRFYFVEKILFCVEITNLQK